MDFYLRKWQRRISLEGKSPCRFYFGGERFKDRSYKIERTILGIFLYFHKTLIEYRVMTTNNVTKASSLLSVLLIVFSSLIAQDNQQVGNNFFKVSNSYIEYNSPAIGNGEIVTTIGTTGYHNGFCPDNEKVNRTIFWAGRRMKDANSATIRIPRVPPEKLIGATKPLIRFGRLTRKLSINGKESKDEIWEQELVAETGNVISRLNHDGIIEETNSTVCLNSNVLVFKTTFTNQTQKRSKLEFTIDYKFGDPNGELANGTRFI